MATILVIEDEPGIRMVLKLALESKGHEVAPISNGLSGLKWLEENPAPDLIFSDLSMPGIGGRDLILKLRSCSHWEGIPVVIITGLIPNRSMLPPEGTYSSVLQKPFKLEDIYSTAENILYMNDSPYNPVLREHVCR